MFLQKTQISKNCCISATLNFPFVSAVLTLWLELVTKKHLVRVKRTLCFCLKFLIFLATNMPGGAQRTRSP